ASSTIPATRSSANNGARIAYPRRPARTAARASSRSAWRRRSRRRFPPSGSRRSHSRSASGIGASVRRANTSKARSPRGTAAPAASRVWGSSRMRGSVCSAVTTPTFRTGVPPITTNPVPMAVSFIVLITMPSRWGVPAPAAPSKHTDEANEQMTTNSDVRADSDKGTTNPLDDHADHALPPDGTIERVQSGVGVVIETKQQPASATAAASVRAQAEAARAAWRPLARAGDPQRSAALQHVARLLSEQQAALLAANAEDVARERA